VNIENNRLLEKHRKELSDRVKYNQNHLRKFEREQQTDFEDELKRFQQEQTKQYKMKKDTFKKVILSLLFFSFYFSRVSFPGNSQFINTREKRKRR